MKITRKAVATTAVANPKILFQRYCVMDALIWATDYAVKHWRYFLLGREKLVSRPLRLLGLGVSNLREPMTRQLALL